jgi:hypothetical protein
MRGWIAEVLAVIVGTGVGIGIGFLLFRSDAPQETECCIEALKECRRGVE